MQCMLIGQTHTKHRLPGIFKKLSKNIYSTNMENSDNNCIYLLSAALCSFLSLDDNNASSYRRFSQIFVLF